MKALTMTRRTVFDVGAAALVGTAAVSYAALAQGGAPHGSATESTVRRWYKAWEQREWGPIDQMLADDFTFTSANDDDHINKSTFKSRCWETQKDFIAGFDIEELVVHGNDAFVKYLCHTVNGRSFRNVEYIRLYAGKLQAIECYFGGRSTFPSAVSAKDNMA
jgi:hypothetical protein